MHQSLKSKESELSFSPLRVTAQQTKGSESFKPLTGPVSTHWICCSWFGTHAWHLLQQQWAFHRTNSRRRRSAVPICTAPSGLNTVFKKRMINSLHQRHWDMKWMHYYHRKTKFGISKDNTKEVQSMTFVLSTVALISFCNTETCLTLNPMKSHWARDDLTWAVLWPLHQLPGKQ